MPVSTAILLAAGLGTRLQPITNSIPKCLVPIDGRPLLYYWIDCLIQNGVNKIYINTHYFADKVVEAIRKHPHSKNVELVFETELLGTAGTIRNILNIHAIDDESVLVAHADNLCFCNWLDFFDFHLSRKLEVDVTMMAFQTDTPSSCGILQLDNNNRLVGFHEKVANPPGNLANGAVYVFAKSALDFIKDCQLITPDLSVDIIPSLLEKIQVWENTVYLRDIGTPESYEQAQKDVANNLQYIIKRNDQGEL